MKYLLKLLPMTPMLFPFQLMGLLLSTDVYLMNKMDTSLIRGPIHKVIGKFTYTADQLVEKKGKLKIKPCEKVKLFSIPRLFGSKDRFHEKYTLIKREGDKDSNGIVLHISARRKSIFHPTKIDVYWNINKNFTLTKKFTRKFGKLFNELHITVTNRAIINH